MAYVNFQSSFVRFKIVYYGPGLSGKTTNLEKLNEIAGPDTKMVSLETEGDRTIFFDYLPLNLGKLGGVEAVFKLYTVPGQVRYNRTRRMVLRDLDGVVFVADSQRTAMSDNIESLRNLHENLSEEGLDPAFIPMVMQYNKRDLGEICTTKEMNDALNPTGRQWFEASAIEGRNVEETLSSIVREVYRVAAERYGLIHSSSRAPAAPDPDDEAFLASDTWAHALALPDDDVDEDTGPLGSTIPTFPSLPPSATSVGMGTPSLTPAALGSGIDERLAKQLGEIREILQHVVMTQAESEQLADLGDGLTRAQRELGAAVERGFAGLVAMRDSQERILERIARIESKLAELDAGVGSLREDIRREVRGDVDRYLAEFIEMADPLVRPSRTDPPASAPEMENKKPVAVGPVSARNMRETNAPPRRRFERSVGTLGDGKKN